MGFPRGRRAHNGDNTTSIPGIPAAVAASAAPAAASFQIEMCRRNYNNDNKTGNASEAFSS